VTCREERRTSGIANIPAMRYCRRKKNLFSQDDQERDDDDDDDESLFIDAL